MRRLLYTSRAAEGVSKRDVYRIVRVAQNRNSQAGITGGLIFIDGYFLQLLEGEPAAIDERYERIRQDSRHEDVITRFDERVEAPLFESEWMALRDGEAIDPCILREHGYEIGLPNERFGPTEILRFLLACFTRGNLATK